MQRHRELDLAIVSCAVGPGPRARLLPESAAKFVFSPVPIPAAAQPSLPDPDAISAAGRPNTTLEDDRASSSHLKRPASPGTSTSTPSATAAADRVVKPTRPSLLARSPDAVAKKSEGVQHEQRPTQERPQMNLSLDSLLGSNETWDMYAASAVIDGDAHRLLACACAPCLVDDLAAVAQREAECYARSRRNTLYGVWHGVYHHPLRKFEVIVMVVDDPGPTLLELGFLIWRDIGASLAWVLCECIVDRPDSTYVRRTLIFMPTASSMRTST